MVRSVGAYASDATCSVDGCDQRPRSRGCCLAHYKRLIKHGDPTVVVKRIARYSDDATCKADGCDRKPRANGLCSMHWMRLSTAGELGGGETTKPRGVICSVDGCPVKRVGVHGYCQKHYTRVRRTGVPGAADVIELATVCWWCDRPFTKPDGRTLYCSRECATVVRGLKKASAKYDMTPTAYRRFWRAQAGTCAICRKPERTERNRILAIDHDHVSGHVRGLLCSHCNRAVGLFEDDPLVIKRAAEYVASTRQITLFPA